jgi:alpha-beta hydrolase superfamily lysophospholipase
MAVERVQTHDGLSLVVEHCEVAGARARVVLVHGYAEHRGRYRQLVEQLGMRGIECHLFDLRGHGESDGPRGHVPRFEDYLDDLRRVAATVPLSGAKTPLFLFGHSLGALIALCFVRAHPNTFKAMAVSSPFLGPAFPVPAARLMLARVASLIAPAVNFESGLRPEWVSRDPEMVAAYAADPHVFRTTTPRWFTEVTAAQRELIAHASEITTPALFLVAGSDRIADHRLSLDLFEKLGTQEPLKRLRTYAESYHEIFNELPAARAEVTQDLFSWLEERTLARSLHGAVSSGGLHE